MCILSLAVSLGTSLGVALGSMAATVGSAAAAVAGTIGSVAGTVGSAAASIGSAAWGGLASAGSFIMSTGWSSSVAAGSSVGWGGTGLLSSTSLQVMSVMGSVAGGVTSLVTGVQASKNAQAQADYMEEIEEENARIADAQAQALSLQADQEYVALRQKMLANRAAGRNAYAAGGVVLGSGSAANFEADIADAYDLDAKNLDYDVAGRVWQTQMSGRNAANQAKLYGMQSDAFGSQAIYSGIGGAMSTVGALGSGLADINRSVTQDRLFQQGLLGAGAGVVTTPRYGGQAVSFRDTFSGGRSIFAGAV